MDFPILTTLIVLPIAAGIAVLLLPRRRPELAPAVAARFTRKPNRCTGPFNINT